MKRTKCAEWQLLQQSSNLTRKEIHNDHQKIVSEKNSRVTFKCLVLLYLGHVLTSSRRV